jgi:hypothetical protein
VDFRAGPRRQLAALSYPADLTLGTNLDLSGTDWRTSEGLNRTFQFNVAAISHLQMGSRSALAALCARLKEARNQRKWAD